MKKVIGILVIMILLITSLNVSAEEKNLNESQRMVLSLVKLARTFTDAAEHWARESIATLVDQELINGYPDGTFKPNGNITKSEFSTINRKVLQLSLQDGSTFNDTTTHWAKDEINTLVQNNIIVKAEEGENYFPNKNITRIEIAKMIIRSLGLDDEARALSGKATTFIDDKDIKSADKGYVILASQKGVINGYPDNSFKPGANATRGEASKMITNMLEIMSGIDMKITPAEKKTTGYLNVVVLDMDNYSIYNDRTSVVTTMVDTLSSSKRKPSDETPDKLFKLAKEDIDRLRSYDITVENYLSYDETFSRGYGSNYLFDFNHYNLIIDLKEILKAEKIVLSISDRTVYTTSILDGEKGLVRGVVVIEKDNKVYQADIEILTVNSRQKESYIDGYSLLSDWIEKGSFSEKIELVNNTNSIELDSKEKFIDPIFKLEVFHQLEYDPKILQIMLVNNELYNDDYTFKFECINYPEINKRSPFGPNYPILELDLPRPGSDLANNLLIFSLRTMLYTTSELQDIFKLKEGMKLDFKITVSKGDVVKNYYLSATTPKKSRYY